VATFAYLGNPATVRALLAAGADPDFNNAHQVSPRTLANRIATTDVARHMPGPRDPGMWPSGVVGRPPGRRAYSKRTASWRVVRFSRGRATAEKTSAASIPPAMRAYTSGPGQRQFRLPCRTEA